MFGRLIKITTLTAIFIFFAIFTQKYIPYMQLKWSSESRQGLINIYLNQSNIDYSTKALEHLNELIHIPLIGFVFDDERILQLALLRRFQESLRQANTALQNILHSGSFNIWYIKAFSECHLNQVDECMASLNKASRLSRKRLERLMMHELYDYIDLEFLQTEAVEGTGGSVPHTKQERKIKREMILERRMRNIEEI